jgi:hypothetical protein
MNFYDDLLPISESIDHGDDYRLINSTTILYITLDRNATIPFVSTSPTMISHRIITVFLLVVCSILRSAQAWIGSSVIGRRLLFQRHSARFSPLWQRRRYFGNNSSSSKISRVFVTVFYNASDLQIRMHHRCVLGRMDWNGTFSRHSAESAVSLAAYTIMVMT